MFWRRATWRIRCWLLQCAAVFYIVLQSHLVRQEGRVFLRRRQDFRGKWYCKCQNVCVFVWDCLCQGAGVSDTVCVSVCERGRKREREYGCLCELVWVRGQAKDHENWPKLICLELNEITALWWCIFLCCSVLQCYSWSHEIKCCALQWCVEMCCRVLQCVVVCCICCGLLQYYS